MTNASNEPSTDDAPPEAVAETIFGGPPFGPAFFAGVLPERVRVACEHHPDPVAVVELHLADGTTLDLCHVPALDRQWLAVHVYRDRVRPDDMDLAFVPYGLVTRVTVSVWQRSQRALGFAPRPHEQLSENMDLGGRG